MFHEPRRALVGVGLTLAGVTVAGVALAGSKALGGLAGGGLLVVAVAGYVTAVIGVLLAGYMPLLLLIAPFAVLSHLLLLPLRQRAGAVYHNGYKRGKKVVAWRSAHDRVVVVRLFKRISDNVPETVEGVSIFRPAWQRSRLCRMLVSAGVPRVSDTLAELCEITRRWTSAIRWSLEPDGGTGEVALNVAVDDRNRLALDQLHASLDRLWNSDDLSRDDIFRLAVWYAMAADAFYGHKDQGILGRALQGT